MREIHARAYVESLLREHCGILEVRRDPDGDYPVDASGSCVFVSVTGEGLPRVGFVAAAILETNRSPELLIAMNEQNRQLPYAKIVLVGDAVWVSADVLANTLDGPSFLHMLRTVVHAAQGCALRLAEVSEGQIVIGTAVDFDADEWNVLLNF